MAKISDFEGDYIGLSKTEMSENRKMFSKNSKRKATAKPLLSLIVSHITEPFVIVLLVLSILCFLTRLALWGTALLVFAAAHTLLYIAVNKRSGEYAEELAKKAVPRVPVLSKEEIKMISAEELLPGDIVVLQKGDNVPADCTILEQRGLMADEYIFTGSHASNYKYDKAQKDDGKIKNNCVYLGTRITEGKAVVRVLAIGERALAYRSGKLEQEPPLRPAKSERSITFLYRFVSVASIAVLALSFVYVMIFKNGLSFTESLVSASGLALSMVPALVPAAVSLIIYLNAKQNEKSGVFYVNYKAAEELKKVSVLCVDKTGVITGNNISVADTYAFQKGLLAHISTLSCGLYADNPIDSAILKYCEKAGADVPVLQSNYLVHSFPLEPKLKLCGHIWKIGESVLLCVKGSVDSVLAMCSASEDEKTKIKARELAFSKKGYSVIAVACKELAPDSQAATSLSEESNLGFIGLIALSDPPRGSVTDSVRMCRNAGIRVLMVTGDSMETASAVANNIGIASKRGIISGETLHNCTDDELCELVTRASVFARVSPDDKLRIVKALQKNGERVAVTVESNSEEEIAKTADVAICMLEDSEPYAKENSDIILKSNSFEKIASAIFDGKILQSRIVKTVGCCISVYITMFLTNFISFFSYSSYPLFLPVDVVYLSFVFMVFSVLAFSKIKYMPRGRHTNNLTIILRTLVMTVSSLVLFRANFAKFSPMTMRGLMLFYFTYMIMAICISEADESRLSIVFLIKLFKSKRSLAILIAAAAVSLSAALVRPVAGFLSSGIISFSMLAAAFLTAVLTTIINDIIKLVKS